MEVGRVEPGSVGYVVLARVDIPGPVTTETTWEQIEDTPTLREAKEAVEEELGSGGAWKMHRKENEHWWSYSLPNAYKISTPEKVVYVKDSSTIPDRLVDMAAITGMTLIGVAAIDAILD